MVLQPTGADTIIQVMIEDAPITLLQSGYITMDHGASIWICFDLETLDFLTQKLKTT